LRKSGRYVQTALAGRKEERQRNVEKHPRKEKQKKPPRKLFF